MGLSWQTGPLSRGAIGLFFVPGPLPKRLLYASRCAGACACASAEPGSPIARMSSCRSNLCRCPVAYFAETDVSSDTLHRTEQTSRHPEPRSRLLVHRPSGRADRTARGVATGLRERVAGAGRVRLASHGRLLRRRRTDPSDEFWRCASASSEDFSERVLSLCFQKTKEKMIWQQAKRETRNTGKGIS